MRTVHPGALTVDVEDWFHPELVRGRVPADDPRSVVGEGVDVVLGLLAKHGVRGTFFVLGEVVARHPELLRRIAAGGHEIACHGLSHRPLWTHTPASLREELRGFRRVLRDTLGRDDAIGYRAPTFSLDRSTAWALAVLREEGFRYDSSVFPMRVRLYGVAGAPLGIYRPAGDDPARPDPGAALVEFPVAVAALGPARLPVAGGFYLRALPWAVLAPALDRIARERPFNLFLHPWECAPRLPRVALGPADALITYAGLGSVPAKLDRLLGRYRFDTMRGILESGGHLARAPEDRS